MLLTSNTSSAPSSDFSSACLHAREPVAVQAAVVDPLLEIDPHGAERRQRAAPVVARVDVLGADLADGIVHGGLLGAFSHCALRCGTRASPGFRGRGAGLSWIIDEVGATVRHPIHSRSNPHSAPRRCGNWPRRRPADQVGALRCARVPCIIDARVGHYLSPRRASHVRWPWPKLPPPQRRSMPARPTTPSRGDYNFAADILGRNLEAGRAGKPVYIDPRGTWTYGQLAERVERFGRVLRSLGIRREERMLLCLLDTIDWPTAFLGAIKAGVVPVPVNTLMTEDDYRFMLADSRARMLVVSEALFRNSRSSIAAARTSCMSSCRAPDAHGHRQVRGCCSRHAPTRSYTAPTTRDDMCFWLYTSGSTGKPKGAVHVHADLRLTDDLYAAPILGIKENDVCYLGREAVLRLWPRQCDDLPDVGRRDHGAAAGSSDARRRRARCCADIRYGVLRACRPSTPRFLASPSAPQRAELKLRRCVSAGEALPPDVGRRWSERYGVDILDGIGSTEMLHIFLSNRPGDVKYGTTGKPVPGYDLRLVDDDGNVIDARARWASCRCAARPARSCIGTTASSRARPSWANGRARATNTSRTRRATTSTAAARDDMLKVGGIYVSPFEVEGALLTHADVLEAAVVGWPDEDELIKPKASWCSSRPDKAGESSRARCRITARRSSRPTNIRAGSSFAPSCRRPRPARSSVSSCGPRAGRADT